jgi:cell division protein FtsI/penicillin-binding protein 2
MRGALRTKLRLFSILVGLFALLVVLRLYYVQVIDGADYALAAERQYERASEALFNRGSIYFTRKDGTLLSAAGLATGFKVALNPKLLKDPEAAYAMLTSHLALDHDAYLAKAMKTDDPYEVIAERVPEAAGEAISNEDVQGVLVERERWRSYPAGGDAAQSVGLVAYDGDDTLSGRYGLERYYDYALRRERGGLFGNFFTELFAEAGRAAGNARDAGQGDLITSIEPAVARRLYETLREVQERYESAETGGIIMDPSTGEVIALGTVPSFEPEAFSDADPALLGNPLVEHQYEFGSIMKALTVASGLDAGVIRRESTYDDTGCTTLNTKTFCNYDLKARGVVPMQEVLSQSLNLGAAHIAGKLGHERFRNYLLKLGFGEETGIDLPSEASGNVENIRSSPRDIEYATASYGQGIAETPVQMVKALGALANKGMVVTPHLVTSVRLESGIEKKLAWGEPERVFSPDAAEETTSMLVKVVDTKLADGTLSIPSMSVAAKTGTAQMAGAGGKYAEGKYFHSFFGYFPAYAPRFIILLYTREPQGVQYASETLTHPFMDLTHFLINYYAIPPDRAGAAPAA